MYLIPGRHESFHDSFGKLLRKLGYTFSGRELVADFARLRFADQLEQIKTDLFPTFWHEHALLLGHSYGAYLLLHSLAELGNFPGCVLLFSPILGMAVTSDGTYGSIPPRAKKLVQLARNQSLPQCQNLIIHTGTQDHGCDPELAKTFVDLLPYAVLHLVPEAGHPLPQAYVQEILQQILQTPAAF